MRMLKRTAVLALALLCAVPVMTGCGANAKRNQNIAEEDMPYGATMRENKTAFAVPVGYDRRFLEEEQVSKVTDLFAAIQNQDAELYARTTFPFYMSYQKEQVYALDSEEALLEKLHSIIETGTAEDFYFTMVNISDLAANPDAGELHEVIEMLDKADGEGNFKDTVQKSYDLTVEWSVRYNKDTEYKMASDQHVYLFQTADGWFALM